MTFTKSRMAVTAFASLSLLALAGAASNAAGLAAAPKTAGGATMNCSVPNNVVCTIASAKGLKSVKITANTPQGQIDLVNSVYNGCPKSVKVHWDSAYEAAGTKFVECMTGSLKIKAN